MNIRIQIQKYLIVCSIIIVGLGFAFPKAKAEILFQNDTLADVFSGGILLNSNNDHPGDLTIQFGSTLGRTFKWNNSTLNFELSDDLNLQNNQLIQFRAENVTALPGGAGGLGSANAGRIVQLTATDSIAPGCVLISCTLGTYSWNGNIWVAMHGGNSSTASSKIVTVGLTGRDFTSIAGAASDLNSLGGGEMWVDPGTYSITTVVDLQDIHVMGSGSSNTTLSISGGGLLKVRNTLFDQVTLLVDTSITGDFGLDVKYDANSPSNVFFNLCDFYVNSGKVLIDSTAATPPTLLAYFQNSDDYGKTLKNTSLANLNVTNSRLTVSNVYSDSNLNLENWNVTAVEGSNVVTSGIITTVPKRTILVYPGMNIQAAIDSLGSGGGVVKLLIGIHDVTQSINILYNNIKIEGDGPGTILRAQAGTWVGGTTTDDALINIGLTDGTAPRDSVVISNFTVEVGPNIHGIQVNGGTNIKVMDMMIKSIGVKSGSPNLRVGLLFTDGAAVAASKFWVVNNVITNDVPADRWSDGLHFDGDTTFGSYGYNNGISDSIVSNNIVNAATETCYAFTNVSSSSIVSNRARNVGYSSGALALFLNNATDVIVMNNTMEGAFAANVTGFYLYQGVVNSIIANNIIRGGPVNYTVGISSNDASNVGDVIARNQFSNVDTTVDVAGSTATRLEVSNIQSTSNPTVNDDVSDGYEIGTIWINTSNQKSYILTDSSVGAAVWKEITGGSSGTSTGTSANTFTLDNDNTGGNVSLQFGSVLAESLKWNSAKLRFDISNALNIMGNLSLQPANITITNGGNNNVNLSSINSSVIRIVGPTANFNITGFSGGIDGKLLYLINTTSQIMTINNQNGSSTAGNRIITGKGVNINGSGNSTITLIYDGASSRWRVINAPDMTVHNGTYVAINGRNDNIVIPSNNYILISGPTALFKISGIAGGTDGREITLINTTNVDMRIFNNSAYSSSANRILTNNGSNHTTTGIGSVILLYDASVSKWRMIDFTT